MAKKKKRKKTTRAKRFTPRQHQIIRDLAEMVGKLIPATSRGDYSLQRLAKDRGLSKYFNEKLPSKQKQFIFFITKLHADRPRTLKRLINDILAEAVDRRWKKGTPILQAEAHSLREKLQEFGIDLRAEIDGLQLPAQKPKITPPPIVIQQALERLGLHSLLSDKVLPLFNDGYLNEAVRKAGEIFESVVTRWSGAREKYGRDLMAHAFNKDTPIIDVSAYHGSEITNPMDEKEGFMLVAMGSMQWCKNIVGHGDVDQLAPQDASARIVLISHLLDVVDQTMNKKEE